VLGSTSELLFLGTLMILLDVRALLHVPFVDGRILQVPRLGVPVPLLRRCPQSRRLRHHGAPRFSWHHVAARHALLLNLLNDVPLLTIHPPKDFSVVPDITGLLTIKVTIGTFWLF